jgi:hypothetical protein
MRWTLISMLATAVLAVTRARTAATSKPTGQLAPASRSELLRLLRATVPPRPRRDLGHLLH